MTAVPARELTLSPPQAALRDGKSIALKESLITYAPAAAMLNWSEGPRDRFERRPRRFYPCKASSSAADKHSGGLGSLRSMGVVVDAVAFSVSISWRASQILALRAAIPDP